MIGQPDDTAGIHHGRGRGKIAHPAACQRERLAHCAAHHQLAESGQQSQRGILGDLGELLVRLVDDHDRVGRGADLTDDADRGLGSRWIVGCADHHDVGPVLPDRAEHQLGVQGEVVAPGHGDVVGVRIARVLGIHRIGRPEGQHDPTRAGKGAQNVGHHLI
ncbi:hypothetical protein SDC9_161822 [bioreactor metagenome]|uniref:Uncharacterized protein n=1 Tax=bioreactor metagenome TaxID=1076179 RepID=A0A645FJB5_9ZZZZ